MSGTQKVSGAWSSKLLCGDFNARSNCKIKFYWRGALCLHTVTLTWKTAIVPVSWWISRWLVWWSNWLFSNCLLACSCIQLVCICTTHPSSASWTTSETANPIRDNWLLISHSISLAVNSLGTPRSKRYLPVQCFSSKVGKDLSVLSGSSIGKDQF